MKKTLLTIVLASLCQIFSNNAFAQVIKVQGMVTTELGQPVPNATITIKDREFSTITDDNGKFYLDLPNGTYTLTASHLGFQAQVLVIQIPSKEPFAITLKQNELALQEVAISTGYQTLPKERATGSFVQIDNKMLNRSVSTNILDRLKGVTSAVAFNDNGTSLYQQSKIEVRGRSTLFSPGAPLIILDNFPYEGNLENINPNDIESITILKDAAAASIWGTKSGNGVIVITSKKGALDSKAQISVNSSFNVGAKPNVFYLPQLSSAQYIEVEDFLFDRNAYNGIINNGYAALSPAVEIFAAKRSGLISEADSILSINKLKTYDVREQILKYGYRNSVNQQHQLNVAGGGSTQKYFVSAGYDKNLSNRYNSGYDRMSVNASNTYYFLNKKLELFTNIIFTSANDITGIAATNTAYPYDQLADDNGNPLVLARTLRPSYAATAGNGKLLNWLYKPLEEQQKGYGNTINNLTDYRLNLSLNYKVLTNLNLSGYYSFGKGVSDNRTLYELASYYTRDQINRFTQINATSGAVTYPFPMGAILNTSQGYSKSHNGRLQLGYDKQWQKHSLTALVGSEIRNNSSLNSMNTLYGYDEESATNQNQAVNYTINHPLFYNRTSTAGIPAGASRSNATNRFLSFYINASYTFDNRYVASASARRDESNLFGVDLSAKGVPLWSAGLAWHINRENFYNVSWIPELKLRATYGYTGNVNNSISAYLTSRMSGTNLYNVPTAVIVNPPNPSLRWEKVQNANLGLDFSMIASRLSGSLDIWRKKGLDLIGNSPIAAQTGIILYTGNSANTLTRGLDLQLNSVNLRGRFGWTSMLLYNYTSSKVTAYKVSNGTNYNVVSANHNNPLEGFPFYSVFSFRYGGLDAAGNPQAYLNNELSTNYASIRNSVIREELVYHGPAVPVHFGSLMNTLSYAGFDFSFNISYKLGHFYRRSSLENGTIYSISGAAQMADYDKRWKKPGDEKTTQVPSLLYPANSQRDNVYKYSDVLVEKADHIRIQDVRLGYKLRRQTWLPINQVNLFAYASNLGIVWKASSYKLDPDYPVSIPAVRMIAFGLNAKF